MAPTLLTLPPEIRRMILEELLVQHHRFTSPRLSLLPIKKTDDETNKQSKTNPFVIDDTSAFDTDSLEYRNIRTSGLWPDRKPNMGAILVNSHGRPATNAAECSVPILRACRQLLAEGQHLLYEKNVFDLSTFLRYSIPLPVTNGARIFSSQIGHANWCSIRHVDIDVHYLLRRIEYAKTILTLEDNVSPWWMFKSWLLEFCTKYPLPRLQSLKIFLPQQNRRARLYRWCLRAGRDDVAEFVGMNKKALENGESDHFSRFLLQGIRDVQAVIEIVIFRLHGMLARGPKHSVPKGYIKTEDNSHSILLTNTAMPAQMISDWDEIDVPQLQSRLEKKEKEILPLREAFDAQVEEREREWQAQQLGVRPKGFTN